MRYTERLLHHFYNPKNVGSFAQGEPEVGRATVGSYENGVVIHFEIRLSQGVIIAARFKAYGNCAIIAACSYASEWVTNKTLTEANQLTSSLLITELGIPELKIHCALLVEDVLKSAIKDMKSSPCNCL